MNNAVYSLPQERWIDDGSLPAIMADPAISQEEFYNRCITVFPVVLDAMTAGEVMALRAQQPTETDRGTATNAIMVSQIMQENIRQLGWSNIGQIVPSTLLPSPCIGVPLLGSWLTAGQRLYGLSPDQPFFFGETKTLGRPAAPVEQVIGHCVHGDSSLRDGHLLRAVSILSVCAEPSLDQSETDALELHRPWWTTRWNDMRDLDYADFMADDHLPIKQRYNNPMRRMLLPGQCPERPLPDRCHVAMPPWMLHTAGGLSDVPDGIVKGLAGPRAIVSHAVLHRPTRKAQP